MGMNIVFIIRYILISALIIFKLVSFRYLKGFDLFDVFKKVYRYSGIWVVFWKVMVLSIF